MHLRRWGWLLPVPYALVVMAAPPPAAPIHAATNLVTKRAGDPPVTILSRRRTNHCNQDPRLRDIEAQAWADAGAIAEIAHKWEPGNELQPALDYWMGRDSQEPKNAEKIRRALDNQRAIHHPNKFWPEAVVDIYCGDTHPVRNNKCREKTDPNNPNGPKVTAYASSWVSRGITYNVYNVVLCPRFFEQKQSLESILRDMRDGKRDARNASEYKRAWGHTIYHELMHLDPVISEEDVGDRAYGDCMAAKLARQNGCSGDIRWKRRKHTFLNADSWAFFAGAAYFQQAMHLVSPGRAGEDWCGIDNADDPPLPPAEVAGGGLEGVWEPPEDRTDGTYNATAPPEPRAENIPPDDPPTPAVPYEKTALPATLATPFDAAAYFATYTPAPTPAPTDPAAPLERCRVEYGPVRARFDIWGSNWVREKLNPGDGPGSGLRTQLEKCSTVGDWEYGMWAVTPEHPYAFHARGTVIKRTQKRCIERAMEAAGAPKGECSSG